MRPVFAAARDVAQLDDFIELVVAVGVLAAIEATARSSVADDVERIERPQQTLRARHWLDPLGLVLLLLINEFDVEMLDLGFVTAADLRRRDSAETEVALIADDQPPLRIGRDVDPRAKRFLRDREESFHLETGEQVEQVTRWRRLSRIIERLAARMVAKFEGDCRRHGLLGVARFGDLPTRVGHDKLRRAIRTEQHDLRNEARRAVAVRDFRLNHVRTGDELCLDVALQRLVPVVVRAELLAVERQRRHVVARGTQQHRLGMAAVERFPEDILLAGIGSPNPTRLRAFREDVPFRFGGSLDHRVTLRRSDLENLCVLSLGDSDGFLRHCERRAEPQWTDQQSRTGPRNSSSEVHQHRKRFLRRERFKTAGSNRGRDTDEPRSFLRVC